MIAGMPALTAILNGTGSTRSRRSRECGKRAADGARSCNGAAWPGKCLPQAAALRDQTLGERRRVPRDEIGIIAERALCRSHGLSGLVFTSSTGA